MITIEDPGFDISVGMMLVSGAMFIVFIAVIVGIVLLVRRFSRRGRQLDEINARLARIEASLQQGKGPDEPGR